MNATRQIVRILVEAGAQIDLDRQFRCSELEQAARIGDYELWHFLYSRGAKLTPRMLSFAVEGGSESLVQFLLAEAADPIHETFTFDAHLISAIENNSVETLELLFEKDTEEKDVRHRSCPVQCSAKFAKLVQILLTAGTHGNMYVPHHKLTISTVLAKGDPQVLKIVLDAEAENITESMLKGQLLHMALKKGRKEVALQLLSRGKHVEIRHGERSSPSTLHYAIETGDRDLVTSVLKAGADVDCGFGDITPSIRGEETPLTWAVETGDLILVQCLLDAGADINNPWALKTPLEVAVTLDTAEILLCLLNAGADPNDSGALARTVETHPELTMTKTLLEAHKSRYGTVRRNFGGTALRRAIILGNFEAFNAILAAGVSPNHPSHRLAEKEDYKFQEEADTALAVAIKWRSKSKDDFVSALLKHGADPNSEVNTMSRESHLVYAINCEESEEEAEEEAGEEAGEEVGEEGEREGDLNPISFFDGADAYLTRLECSPLQAADGRRDERTVRLLLEYGANVNGCGSSKSGTTALQAAVMIGDEQTVRLLLENGANINDCGSSKSGSTALQAAAAAGNERIVRLLLTHGANVNDCGSCKSGSRALQAAAAAGDEQTIRLLLENGANVNACGSCKIGYTDLQAAVRTGDEQIVQLLLTIGADVDAPAFGKFGRTALQTAAGIGKVAIVQLLLNAGASPNEAPASNAGVTSLQAASIGGCFAVASLLLAKGADVNAPAAPTEGRTALEGAAEHGRIDMVRLILDSGANLFDDDASQYDRAMELASEHGHVAITKLIKSRHDNMRNSWSAGIQCWPSATDTVLNQTLNAPSFVGDSHVFFESGDLVSFPDAIGRNPANQDDLDLALFETNSFSMFDHNRSMEQGPETTQQSNRSISSADGTIMPFDQINNNIFADSRSNHAMYYPSALDWSLPYVTRR